jgi:YegS/Rv2252/BmrU family lipid kinase
MSLIKFPRLLVIHNPVSGRCRAALLEAVLQRLRAAGCAVDLRLTGKRGDAERLAAEAAPDRYDAVAVAGGDGTINEVVNGMTASSLPLGLIPMGTANVLAAELGLPQSAEGIARTLLEGRRQHIDLGLASGRRFVMMAGIGFDAHVVRGIDPRLKRAVGKGAYVWQSLVEIARYRPQRFLLTIDGTPYAAASAVFANGHYYAGRYTCAPDATLTDSLLHVCLFKTGGRLAVIRYGASLLIGLLHRRDDVEIVPATRIRVEGEGADPVHGDGDIIAGLPLEVGMDPKGIDVIVPQVDAGRP